MLKFKSALESIEYESIKPLRKYKRILKKINARKDYYRKLSIEDLKDHAITWNENFDIHNKKNIIEVFSLAREVTYRLLGKFQYDVQILGALAALERKIIQMSTGSGKTITLILPAVAYGLTHKGCNVLTVNEYLSERDFNETRIVYEFFGLTCAYTNNNENPKKQRKAFNCDITYTTNSTLGFAYLNSCLASDINQDIKIINRPLHVAIIDEVDEILMDDAINPLIIASQAKLDKYMIEIEHNGVIYKTQDIIDGLKSLRYMEYDEKEGGEPFIADRSWDEIYEKFGFDDSIFENFELIHVIYNAITAIFKYKLYDDYVVSRVPDPDSGSRIILIDKATGRLSRGRTLNENLHAFVEMKEGVFIGQATDSSIQITYQVLFNLFESICGVTGTIGKCYKEFYDIYNASVVVIPDRLPNQLKEKTRLYMTKEHLFSALIKEVEIYKLGRFPVLIGCESDNIANIVSKILKANGIVHDTLLSTDDNEEYVIGRAGEVNSVVVTTDIMGRGTDIKVQETDYERGLAVFQIGNRPNSRVERQFAGRAARQGEPGLYFRLLSLPELENIGFSKKDVVKCMRLFRTNKEHVGTYDGDLLLNGYAPYYNEVVDLINEKLYGDESSYSSNRVQNYKSTSFVDNVQVAWIERMDDLRKLLKKSMANEISKEEFVLCLIENSYEYNLKEENLEELESKLLKKELILLQETLYNHVQKIIFTEIKNLRLYAEDAQITTRCSSLAKIEVKSEEYFKRLMIEYVEGVENNIYLKLENLLDS